MKAQFLNSQYNNNLHVTKLQSIGKEQKKQNLNTHRPAQTISFSGSAVSGIEKTLSKAGNIFLESRKINGLIGYVNKNEAGFNAIYALIVAGMIKPGLVLAQTGHNDKDGQMIATKNFLQSFVGFILGMTVGGGFVKKIYDKIDENLHLINVEHDGNRTFIFPKAASNKSVKAVARKQLIKEHSTLKDRWNYAKDYVELEDEWINKYRVMREQMKKYKYEPDKELVAQRAEVIANNFARNHFPILNKSRASAEFIGELVENMNEIKANPNSARAALKEGLRSQPHDAFESVFKRSADLLTVIAKAKISSLLLPSVVLAIFAKRNAEVEKQQKEVSGNSASTIAINKSKENHAIFDIVHSPDKPAEISFTGDIIQKAIDKSAQIFESGAVSKGGQWLSNGVAKISKKPSHLMSHIESWGITFYWLLNTHFSPKIDPDQKLGLNVHTAIVTIVSSIASYVIDNASDFLIKKAQNGYEGKMNQAFEYAKKEMAKGLSEEEAIKTVKKQCSKLYNKEGIDNLLKKKELFSNPQGLKSSIEGLSANYAKHLSKVKSLLIFITVVRFLVPILMVKPGKKIKSLILNFRKKQREKKEYNPKMQAQKTA